MMDKYSLLQKIGIYTSIVLFITFMLLPFVEMFIASLRPLTHLFSRPEVPVGETMSFVDFMSRFWSDKMSFQAYRDMWVTVPQLPRYIFNSVFLATSVTFISLCFVIPAAYAYARFSFKGKSVSLTLFLAVNMFTGAVLLIPLYKLLRMYGLLNTYWAMIIPGVAFLIPQGIWLLKTFLEKIPYELEEAAFVDGASRLYTLRRVILPLAVPGLIVVGIAIFIGAYAQQFLFAITFNQNRDYMPLPAGIFEFIGYQTVLWNEMMAASLVGVLPVLFIFLFMQKHLIAGLTSGAVKE
ncbi:MAG: carbohydrate ABC transporter permease [Candidatus Thioglobus sp.]|jgi:multiple sugar transport system permease protein|nr:carbohydrate ABC transporter permease [Candidatus Thioglobus sp.]